MFIMLLIIFFQQFLPWLKTMGRYTFHLHDSFVYSYYGLGDFFRLLFFNQAVPIILMFIVLSHHLHKFPKIDWRIIFTCAFLVTSITCSTIILNNNKFVFEGYENLGTSILVYSSIILYLSFILKEIPFLQKVLIITLAVLTVSHAWETPYTLMAYLNSSSHLYYWVLGISEWSIPIVFWFHAIHKIYHKFMREHPFLIGGLISSIVLITFATIQFKLLGSYWIPIGFTLRLNYSLLLVFLPFYFYTKGIKK